MYVVFTLGEAITTSPEIVFKPKLGDQVYVLAPVAVNVELPKPAHNNVDVMLVMVVVGRGLVVINTLLVNNAQPDPPPSEAATE